MRFTVLRSKAVSRDKQRQPSLVNSMPTTRQWEIQNSIFLTPEHFFPDFSSAQNMVRVIEIKNI